MREVELKEIGRGGNAKVFLSALEKSGENCVVKIAESKKEAFLQLENEFGILEYLNKAGYKHSPIPYFCNGKELVMEYIDGITLDRVNFESYSEADLKNLLLDICGVVEELHDLGPAVIHRDIKPSNIMLDKKGKVYLIDFGTAKMADGYRERQNLNAVGAAVPKGVGTRRYAAPEQYGGLSEESCTTDIYQLGKTAEFLLSKAYVSAKFEEEILRVVKRCCVPDSRNRFLRMSELKGEFMAIHALRKRKSIKTLVQFVKKSKSSHDKMRKKRGKCEAFIDIVRTFDTIEFL